ncbi:MAG: DASS family sodium-coupled anion symporter [Alphaproteobacteria bacterium]
MQKKEVNFPILITIFILGLILWNLHPPSGLTDDAWHLFITFLLSITGIITSAMPMGAVSFTAICVLVLTHTLTLKEGLAGFSSPIAWLVVLAFFIARGLIKTNLGQRIAYYLITKFGKNSIGLAYSLIFTEFVLAPMIPSTSARGGGIIYPIAQSLANEYDKTSNKASKTSAFLIMTCFHTNVVCCALFLTSMAANPLMVNLASHLGINISWANWALASIIPGITNLILLPYFVSFLITPDKESNLKIIETAKKALSEQGSLKRNEVIMLITFVTMLFMWIFSKSIGIDTTTTALIGFLALVMLQVINWNDVVGEKAAWETLIWYAILLILSEYLAKYGIDRWIENNIRDFTEHLNLPIAVIILGIFYFYSHYLFASITARVTVMYATFLLILTELGLPTVPTALALAIFSNLSAGLTHYGINSAPIYFSSGYFSTAQWLRIGAIIASLNLVVWLVVGGIWWKIIGWW